MSLQEGRHGHCRHSRVQLLHLPVIFAAVQIGLDWTSRLRERRSEIFLLYLFGLGVAGSGIGGFFGHFSISDSVAESIGWADG